MSITNEAKDRFVAPEISSFTAALIPDMSAVSPEQEHWLVNFTLNTMLRVTVDEGVRRTLYNFLRRTMMTFREYAAARQMTMAYLANPNPDAISEYIVAIGHWEIFLSQADQAWDILSRGAVRFQKGDGTLADRLRHMHNRTKHIASAVRHQETQFPFKGTLPVWLKNDGLHGLHSQDGVTTVRVVLTFEEIAEMLKELAVLADAVQDPLTMVEKITAYYGLPAPA
jgi:hypothetical protein